MGAEALTRTLVIGGTRGTGLLIARSLVQRGAAVRVLARDPARAAEVLDPAVEIVAGDLTKPVTLPPAVAAVDAIILTAGCRSGRPARESTVKATEFDGVRSLLAAAHARGFHGRFLYMTASSVGTRSLAGTLLNWYKGNTLKWRLEAEREIRNSDLDYTIIRAGFLLNRPGGRRSILVTQEPLPLSLRYRIARQDVADGFIAALEHPRASRATFELVGGGAHRRPWPDLLDRLEPDQ